ncbi:hypothetical protein [Rhizobium sp. NFR03]|uniref:hypothetical protein n=1 Tax=Rhizobium sp. NFR03 TaxID=1566263 RepID=UPI0008BFDFEF|nr:hypothetical protein [Rhizobium sp. NFR03]SER57783.1 hypothetical protein SAMN03159406_00547 [Rhizobium sp. NFR03]
MFTAQEAVAQLDKDLALTGETVSLYRYDGSPRAKMHEVSVNAFVRPVKNDELVGDIKLTDLVVIVSPTGLDGLVPLKKGDKALVEGRELNIEIPKPIRMQSALVRYTLLVRG